MGRGKSMCKSKVRVEKAGYLLYQQVFWNGSKIYLEIKMESTKGLNTPG